MMKEILTALSVLLCLMPASAQNSKAQNVVVVTMDGLRWQEVFTGADSLLSFDTTADYAYKYAQQRFWAPTAEERRSKLMPFFWSGLVKNGLLLGNRQYGNFVNNANPYWFSYPGYNEIFTGFPDTSVNSNDKIPNKNETVFEYLNKLAPYKGKIAVFGSWNRFEDIFNEKRSNLLVNDGFRDLDGKLTDKQKLLNRMQHEMPDLFHGSERMDAATFNMAIEYMKQNKPKLIFFGLGDADEFAHAGDYYSYLDAAENLDGWIRQLWEYIQSDPAYANKTSLIITTDHGRGASAGGNWKHHSQKIEGANQIWIAAIGASIPHTGEQKTKNQLYQGQIAATIAKLLGQSFEPKHKPLPPINF